jgi:hypothetical protein
MKKTNYYIISTQSNENNEIINKSSREYELKEVEAAELWANMVAWLHQDPFRSILIDTDGLEITVSSYLYLLLPED